jgi:hypothetical protein
MLLYCIPGPELVVLALVLKLRAFWNTTRYSAGFETTKCVVNSWSGDFLRYRVRIEKNEISRGFAENFENQSPRVKSRYTRGKITRYHEVMGEKNYGSRCARCCWSWAVCPWTM